MKTIQEKIDWYIFLFWVYWIFSLLAAIGVVVCGIIAYLTKFQEVVTVSQLFLLVLTLLMALYLRINALHYHKIVLQLQNTPRRKAPRAEEFSQRPRSQPQRRPGYEK
ncbi:hypothetical protein [Candidatus Enterococcus ferrettii]|uniref:Uncharacterized protein n=1 Tax=Candidatus Enterococcus ferrettii TaxID=2815324 RepID=A0ABV0EY48_9ENTE|nr:hypothetical protein [Enterococcus sp. 665A]MBO1342877.1 hypothetical protein [Enterococcus sp. 665A]